MFKSTSIYAILNILQVISLVVESIGNILTYSEHNLNEKGRQE